MKSPFRVSAMIVPAMMLIAGLNTGCTSVENTVRTWTGTDQGFAEIDADGNGMVSREEAGANPALAADFGRLDTDQDDAISPAELRAAFTRVAAVDFTGADFNSDGVISRREADTVRPSLRETFDRVDSDDDGNVSESEYQAARFNMLSRIPFSAVDTDADGTIDRKEALAQRYLADHFAIIDIDGDNLINEREFDHARAN